MFNDSLTLLKYETIVDDLGQEIPGDIRKREILCNRKSVSRTEFYNANVDGYRPEFIFEINKLEYENEEYVLYEGIRYKVLRTYLINTDSYGKDNLNWLDARLELTVGRKVGNK